MQTLDQTHVGQIYYIDRILGKDQPKLRELGFIKEKAISLISFNGENAIVKLENARLALSSSYLKQIFVKKERSKEEIVGLSKLEIGQTGIVRIIDATGEIKRRLMDMGITRGTSVLVQKLAPLGDPMELHLRGYALSLRKIDADRIKVVIDKKVD
ncbi:ferrous iron transport protein A [Lactococcus fujiensis]|uniref:Ferrous iron transport protein A n=1 Tax=Lactococcus fujiensis JCM 16395 TaxID=1291764 RepID=A0A2A5RLI3_9LACT|nr:ferrous iron transport protein A [Lactococcus fujiensis]PCS00130.1 ferrous iron transport protein A [Lactococcus fujiensis JCM 16395]